MKEVVEFLARFLEWESGIALGSENLSLLESRVGQVCRIGGKASLEAMVESLRSSEAEPGASRQVLEMLTAPGVAFFSDVGPFEALRHSIVPELCQRRSRLRTLRMWSAACGGGQEPYSIAMTLDSVMNRQRPDWKLEILATDLSERDLHKAREAIYSSWEVSRGLTPRHVQSYFTQKGDSWALTPSIRDMVEFRRFGLLEVPEDLGRFDVIFCRNALLYFDVSTRADVLHGLRSHLHKDGYLFLGAGEVLSGFRHGLHRVTRQGAVCYRLGPETSFPRRPLHGWLGG